VGRGDKQILTSRGDSQEGCCDLKLKSLLKFEGDISRVSRIPERKIRRILASGLVDLLSIWRWGFDLRVAVI
jgi:hypothetical protein